MLYAYASQARPDNNTVDLTFNHANAAFSVNARLASGCTATVNVSGVQLVNVKPTNTLTFSSGSTLASGSNISSTLACTNASNKTLTTSNQSISSAPLILPPQTVTAWSGTSALANTYLAVTCKVQANNNYVVGSSSADGTVYEPMTKNLNKGENNSVNLVFGSEGSNGRYYGRQADGTRIFVSDQKTINNITSDDLGKVICTDGTIYSTVSEASAAGKTAAAMIASLESNIAIALHDMNSSGLNYNNAQNRAGNYTPYVLDYGWKLPSQEDWNEMVESFGNDANGIINALRTCGGSAISGTYWTSSETTIDDFEGEDPIQTTATYTYDTDTNGFDAVNQKDDKLVRYIFYF